MLHFDSCLNMKTFESDASAIRLLMELSLFAFNALLLIHLVDFYSLCQSQTLSGKYQEVDKSRNLE